MEISMGECICSSCKNLKGIVDDMGAVEQYECEHGFPSDECSDCENGECELTCDCCACESEEQVTTRIVKCKTCGKALEQVCSNTEEGTVQCIDCYLKSI
jgi:hypothetical protein